MRLTKWRARREAIRRVRARRRHYPDDSGLQLAESVVAEMKDEYGDSRIDWEKLLSFLLKILDLFLE